MVVGYSSCPTGKRKSDASFRTIRFAAHDSRLIGEFLTDWSRILADQGAFWVYDEAQWGIFPFRSFSKSVEARCQNIFVGRPGTRQENEIE